MVCNDALWTWMMMIYGVIWFMIVMVSMEWDTIIHAVIRWFCCNDSAFVQPARHSKYFIVGLTRLFCPVYFIILSLSDFLFWKITRAVACRSKIYNKHVIIYLIRTCCFRGINNKDRYSTLLLIQTATSLSTSFERFWRSSLDPPFL